MLNNFEGFKSLYTKEVHRFLRVYNQTIIAPLISSMLFLAVFGLSVGKMKAEINGVPFLNFIAPGLIMMTVVQQSFANTSSSMTMGKVLGNIIDILMPPLGPSEIIISYQLAGITRGVICGLVVVLVMSFFIPMEVQHIGWAFFFTIAASLMLSLLGMICGIIAESFDQMSALTNYFITPLSFLSGTFYSIRQLPEFWQKVNIFNPFFYMIDGFRYSMTGHTDTDPVTGAWVLLGAITVLYVVTYRMLSTGYRIKS
jgi:ABC-2 type transport system permease protein